MSCNCNNKLNRNTQSEHYKLTLDSMRQLSTDQIVNLYKDGYRLDETIELYRNDHLSSSKIEVMAYNDTCPGPASTDRYNDNSGSLGPSEVGLYMNNIEAQRFVPTSRCLNSVTLRLKRETSDTTIGVVVDIVQNDGNGNPDISASLQSYTIPGSMIQTYYSNITINIGVVLNNLNPLWIIARSSVYDPSGGPQQAYFSLDGAIFQTSDLNEYSASYIPTISPNWIKNLTNKLYYITDVQTYVQPVPTITVTSPNGGESWIQGTSHPITWTSTNLTGNVKIELLKAGIVNTIITLDTPNSGTYSWIVPSTQTAGNDYSIRITSTSNTTITDSSNANFTIVSSSIATITVTSPNGAEDWLQGSTHNITWTSANLTDNVKIELFKAGILNSIIIGSTPNTGTYSWSIPSNQTLGTDYTIKISSISNPSITDSSNANFTISVFTGIVCNSITTPTAIPSTLTQGQNTTLSSTVTPSSPTSQEFSVQFVDGVTPIGNPVTTVNKVATRVWTPSSGTHYVNARVGSECLSPGTVEIIVNPGVPQAGGSGAIFLAAGALVLAFALLSGSRGSQ